MDNNNNNIKPQKRKNTFFVSNESTDEIEEFDELFKLFSRNREMVKGSSKSPENDKKKTIKLPKILSKLQKQSNERIIHEKNNEKSISEDKNDNLKHPMEKNATVSVPKPIRSVCFKLPDEIYEEIIHESCFVSKYQIIPNRRVSMACKPKDF
uniref:Uncharacterized protein n=1 Tax=Strongyloides venezuelensis TaxID=75913 RepID=A0A0K0EYA4_STRVS